MGYRLAVDLGTTFTAAATVNGSGPVMVGLGNRAMQIPSVLFLGDDGRFVVGEAADRRGVTDPARLVREFKRRLGDHVPLLVGGAAYSAETLMARLLRSVVDATTVQMGEAPEAIICSRPANWGPYKRELFDQVISLADLSRVQQCTEPEAAAVQYATRSAMAAGERVAVYDLGGGTFDVCVLEKAAEGFRLLGSPDGVEHLGGVDFDQALTGFVLDSMEGRMTEVNTDDPANLVGLARLRRDCVEAKEQLSTELDVAVPIALPGLSTTVRLTRRDLESAIRPALNDTVAALQRTLRSADTEPQQLKAIVLVGGSSRIPLVSELLQSEFMVPVALDTHPKHDIALGAARLCHSQEPTAHQMGGTPAGRSTSEQPTTWSTSPTSRSTTGPEAGAPVSRAQNRSQISTEAALSGNGPAAQTSDSTVRSEQQGDDSQAPDDSGTAGAAESASSLGDGSKTFAPSRSKHRSSRSVFNKRPNPLRSRRLRLLTGIGLILSVVVFVVALVLQRAVGVFTPSLPIAATSAISAISEGKTGECAGLTMTNGAVWVSADPVARLDAGSGETVSEVAVGKTTALTATSDAIWAGTDHGTVFRIRTKDSRVAAKIEIGHDEVEAIGAQGAIVWVASGSQLTRIDANTNKVVTRIEMDRRVTAFAFVDGASLWVIGSGGRANDHLLRVDMRSMEVVQTILLDYTAAEIAIAGGKIWLTLDQYFEADASRTLRKIDPTTGHDETVPGPSFDEVHCLIPDEDALWFVGSKYRSGFAEQRMLARIDIPSSRVVVAGALPGDHQDVSSRDAVLRGIAVNDHSLWILDSFRKSVYRIEK